MSFQPRRGIWNGWRALRPRSSTVAGGSGWLGASSASSAVTSTTFGSDGAADMALHNYPGLRATEHPDSHSGVTPASIFDARSAGHADVVQW